MRLILSDYKSSIQECFRHIMKKNGWFFYVYILIGMPLSFRVEFKYLILYEIEMLLLVFMLLISRMYPYRLGKNLYLCPLTGAERKSYMKTAYYVRILLGMVPSLLVNGFLMGAGRLRIHAGLLLLLGYFLFCISVNFYVADTGKEDRKKEKKLYRKYSRFKGYRFFMILAQISGIFYSWILLSMVAEDYEWYQEDLVIMGIAAVVQSATYLIMKLKYEKQIIEIGIHYEDSY